MSATESASGAILRAMESAPVNLNALASDLGLKVVYERMDDKMSGSIERRKDGSFLITINADHHPNRQRFTLAHEIGHFYLHKAKLGDGTNDTRTYRTDRGSALYNTAILQRQETEANNFAAALLMPEKLVQSFYKTLRILNDCGPLARIFGVSKAAMEIRLEGLRERGVI